MHERGEGSSTAIVAIVVLVLIALGVFFYAGGLRRQGGGPDVKIEIDKKTEAPPQQR
jgi:hypothetical protein